jgi:hypothetical protein
MGDPKNVYIDLGLHGTLWLGQSTDMALSALCILAHCEAVGCGAKPCRVVSSRLTLLDSPHGEAEEPKKT